jgi:hypothetical protein
MRTTVDGAAHRSRAGDPEATEARASIMRAVRALTKEMWTMRKQDELSRKDTCMAHAHPQEMTFVLLGRDVAAPFAIRAWADERVRLGKNTETDAQIVEARACADTMTEEGRKWVGTATHYPEGMGGRRGHGIHER